MATATLTKQFILDAYGTPIGVILPIEDYEALVKQRVNRVSPKSRDNYVSPLFGALQYLGGEVASTEDMDAALEELWSTWDKERPE
jgi:hypothetical protein